MIKFFRQIRQRLLSENRLRKYFIYAVGEILLVVIGILLALAINNKSQELKDRRLETDYLMRIRSELVKDTLQFKKKIEENNALREEVKELLSELYSGVNSIDQAKAMSGVFDRALDQVVAVNKTTYSAIVNSNQLGLITNIDLKETLINHYAGYEESAALVNSVNQWMIAIVTQLDTETDFLKFNTNINDIYTTNAMLNVGDLSFLNQKESAEFKLLVRAISAAAFNQKTHNQMYDAFLEACRETLEEIDREIALKKN